MKNKPVLQTKKPDGWTTVSSIDFNTTIAKKLVERVKKTGVELRVVLPNGSRFTYTLDEFGSVSVGLTETIFMETMRRVETTLNRTRKTITTVI